MNKVIARTVVPLFLTVAALHAQEPRLINYQGRVTVGGVNFDGSGQFKFAIVNASGAMTYWSNDNTSTAGSEPGAAVTLTVINGAYSVLLGHTTLPNMAAIPASALNNAELFLRVWFNDGMNGSQLLTPDQRLEMDCTTTNGDAWQQRIVDGTPPAARHSHTAVWTGSEMIVWGGNGGSNTGGRYNPATSAPRLYYHTAVWTGSEMIVWGGYNGTSSFDDTFIYAPDCGIFRITSAVIESGNLTLGFPTVTGRIYTLWSSDTLAAGTWINTGPPAIAGTGATLTFSITAPVGGIPKRYFRVQADP